MLRRPSPPKSDPIVENPWQAPLEHLQEEIRRLQKDHEYYRFPLQKELRQLKEEQDAWKNKMTTHRAALLQTLANLHVDAGYPSIMTG
jgi:FtsZ-binding cell division protein ZapB